MYICLEGIDGSGKSTQLERLGRWLEECGFHVSRIVEPTDSKIGRIIREMLKNPKAQDEGFQRTLALLLQQIEPFSWTTFVKKRQRITWL